MGDNFCKARSFSVFIIFGFRGVGSLVFMFMCRRVVYREGKRGV